MKLNITLEDSYRKALENRIDDATGQRVDELVGREGIGWDGQRDMVKVDRPDLTEYVVHLIRRDLAEADLLPE